MVEIDCRVIPVLEGKCELGNEMQNWRIVKGNTGEKFYITKELVKDDVKRSLVNLKQKGIDSISVALAHSYTYFEHELEVGEIAKEIGRQIIKVRIMAYSSIYLHRIRNLISKIIYNLNKFSKDLICDLYTQINGNILNFALHV